MITTLAVYSKEQETALRLLRWINELGGVRFHTLILATTPQTNPHPLIEEAQKGWGTVEHFVIEMNQEELPWPQGNNANFIAVCKYMNNRGRPFFFMESDVLPLSPGWLDAMEREYQTAGKPFMGEVHAMMDPNRKPIEGTEHMNGSGIYPPGVLSYLPTLPFIMKEPWDIALRFEMMSLVDKDKGGFKAGNGPLGRVPICHPTDIICFCWRTRNYRKEGDRFAYDTEGMAHHRELDLKRHLLHHGCKDDSLMKVMREELFGPQIQKPWPTSPFLDIKPGQPQPAPPETPPKPEPLEPGRGERIVMRDVYRMPIPPPPPVDSVEKKIAEVMAVLSVDREAAIRFIDAASQKTPAPTPSPTSQRLPAAAFRPKPRVIAKRKPGGKRKPKVPEPANASP